MIMHAFNLNLNIHLQIIFIFTLAVYCYLKWKLNYWTRNGLEVLQSTFPFGICEDLILNKVSLAEKFREIYNELKSKGLRHGGFFICCVPFYMPVDNELVGKILKDDFNNFTNHGAYVNEKDDPLSGHLFNLTDRKWTKTRKQLTPTFTPAKLKLAFPIMMKCARGIHGCLEKAANDGIPINVTEIIKKFMSDVVANTAFGLDCDSFEHPNNDFYKIRERLFNHGNFMEKIRLYLQYIVPHSFLRLIKFKATKPDVENFFVNIMEKVVNFRKNYQVHREDYLQWLIQMKNEAKEKDLKQLVIHAYSFYLGGIETSSNTAILALYEIASRPEIQKTIKQEIDEVLSRFGNEITYQAIHEMTYLNMVLQEVLRKYPSIPILMRECGNDYQIPGTKTVLKKGQIVIVSILGLQNHPDSFERPEEFIPERFSKLNQMKIQPNTYLPFGEGPRMCIGLNFASLQMKVALVTLLKNHNLILDNTKTELPIVFSTNSDLIELKNSLWLKPQAKII